MWRLHPTRLVRGLFPASVKRITAYDFTHHLTVMAGQIP